MLISFELLHSRHSQYHRQLNHLNPSSMHYRWRRGVENDLGGSEWSKLWWWMEILFDCRCYGAFFRRLLALFLLLFLLHKHERQHAQKAANGNSKNASLWEFKSRLSASIYLLHLNKSLTMFEARRDDFISSWTGVKSGGRIPITSTNRST